jgi:hypothetical protein
VRPTPLGAVVLAFVSMHAADVLADATTDQKAAAQVLFERGRALVEQGRFAEACPRFAESQKLDPGIGTMLWLADCYENNGQSASAWATFKEAAAAASQAHDKREHVALERAQGLEPKLPRLMIVVPSEAASQGLVVERDGVALGPTQWGLPVPVDPGVHTLAANAPDHKPWTTTVQLPARAETLQVTIPVLDPTPTTAPVVPLAPAAPPTAIGAPSSETRGASGATQRTLGLLIVGAGVIGAGIGTYFSLHAKSTYDDSNAGGHCQGNQCDMIGKQDRSDAFSQATVATVAIGAGAAAIVGGAVLYLTAPKAGPATVGFAPGPRGGTLHIAVDW